MEEVEDRKRVSGDYLRAVFSSGKGCSDHLVHACRARPVRRGVVCLFRPSIIILR